jgi:hypothetical protein
MAEQRVKPTQTKRKTMQTEIKTINIFERLRSGKTIQPNDPEAYKMIEASFATKKLLIRMNSTSDPTEIRNLLGQITGSEIDESTTVFTPLYINY